jgi:uncharacterized membrane-anchored protein YhcB (DUF1043 family)
VEAGDVVLDAVVIGGAVGGLVVGFIFGRQTAPGSSEARDLQKQLDEAQAENRRLAAGVRDHFVAAAEKLNRLTEQYREVHQHMAAGAAALCGGDNAAAFAALEAPRDIEGELSEDAQEVSEDVPAESGAQRQDDGDTTAQAVVEPPRDYAPDDDDGAAGDSGDAEGDTDSAQSVEPPRDYAPKASPDDPGVLNERFGLDDDSSDESGDGEAESADDAAAVSAADSRAERRNG